MSKNTTYLSCSLKCCAFTFLSMGLLLGTGLTNAVAEENPSASEAVEEAEPTEEMKEVEEGDDPEVKVEDSGAPNDCVENDERPACKVKPRGLDAIPVKLKSESRNRCLRPSGGSTRENRAIILSSCRTTKSRYWFRKKVGTFYQLENSHTGKCIERVGNGIRQRTCKSFQDPNKNSQMWSFQNTPPFGTGDFVKHYVAPTPNNCMRANGNNTITVTTCLNNSNRRWFQAAF